MLTKELVYAHYTRDIQWLCGHNFSLFWPPPKYLDVDILNLERGQKLAFLDHLKVSKSQKHFSWNSIAQKTNIILDKILPYEARAEFWPKFRSFFRQWSFKKKCFWDLLTFTLLHCCCCIPYCILHFQDSRQPPFLHFYSFCFNKTRSWLKTALEY